MEKELDTNEEIIPSLREEQVRLTQTRILDTFESELIRHGYAEISMRAVAKRAGMSVPTVYRYYPNKQALLRALMESLTADQGDGWLKILASNTDPMETITKLLDYHWDANEQQPGRTKAVLNAMAAASNGEGGEAAEEAMKRFAFMAREAVAPLSYLGPQETRKLEATVAVLLSRPTWQRLRLGHEVPRDVARSAVLDAARGSIDAAQTRAGGRGGAKPQGQLPDRSEAALKQRYKGASKKL